MIRCYTLFDITRTNATRKKFADHVSELELKQRNQQSNFETIIQIINMRSQPEDIGEIKQICIPIDSLNQYNFGYTFSKKYQKNVQNLTVWTFTFSVENESVFNDGIDDLGNLLKDANEVPMIVGLDESFKQSRQLNISDEGRNIYFEIVK